MFPAVLSYRHRVKQTTSNLAKLRKTAMNKAGFPRERILRGAAYGARRKELKKERFKCLRRKDLRGFPPC